jgi:hypothetical protein
MAEHNTDLSNEIISVNTSILARKPRSMDWFIQETTEIIVHSNNTNKDGFFLSNHRRP